MNWDLLVLILRITCGVVTALVLLVRFIWMQQDIKRLKMHIRQLEKENHNLQVHNGKLYDENQHLKATVGVPSNFTFKD